MRLTHEAYLEVMEGNQAKNKQKQNIRCHPSARLKKKKEGRFDFFRQFLEATRRRNANENVITKSEPHCSRSEYERNPDRNTIQLEMKESERKGKRNK